MGWQDAPPVTEEPKPPGPAWQSAPAVALAGGVPVDTRTDISAKPPPNLDPVRDLIRKNMMAGGASEDVASAAGEMASFGAKQGMAVSEAAVQPIYKIERTTPVKGSGGTPVTSFTDALEAGLQISVSGLMKRGEVPDKVLAEDAPMASRIAANIATVTGDLPWMAAGAILGGAAGAPTGPGAAVTGMAGAFGLPAGLRATLMDAYTKGDFETFGDFWERASGIIWETVKGEVTGAATAVAGGATSAATAAAPLAVRVAAPTAAEIATMVSVGNALEGHVPKAQDFIDAAVLLGGMKVSMATPRLAQKLRETYVRTGETPQELTAAATRDPSVLAAIVDDQHAPAPERPAPATPSELSEAQRAVLERISVGERGGAGYDLRQLYTDAKDELYPIKVLVDAIREDDTLATSKDPYKLARLTRGLAGKADQFLEHSPFKFDTHENVGKALAKIVEPVKDDLDGLRSYLVARRAIELNRRGIETGVPLDEAKGVVSEGGQYAAIAKEIDEFQDHVLAFAKDSGIFSDSQIAAMREANRDYVPFMRVMDTEGAKGAGPGLSVRSPVKAIKGSERKIIDPLESIVKNTYLFTAMAERNAVGRSLVDLAAAYGREDLVRKVAAPVKPVTVRAEDVQKFMDAHGIEGDAEPFTIFQRGLMQLAPDQIAVFTDGKREVYEVPKDVGRAFQGLDQESAGMLTKILAIPAKTLRAGATLAPDFMMRNMVRDQLSAFIFSRNGYVPVLDFMRGLMSVAKKDEDFQAWLKSGGANATLMSLDRQYLQQRVNEIAELQSVRDRVWNGVKLPIEMLRIGSELVENATRLGEFKRAMGEGGKEAAQDAAFHAREVTLDFARIGAKMRGWNMITAFWNAQVEGADRMVRAFKDDPAGSTIKAAAAITMPSILLWWANHDDPRWKEIPSWQRDLFWIVMTKDHIYRIPKPFELGFIFGSVPERILDAYVDHKPDAWDGALKSLGNVFGMNMIPTAAVPVIEHVTNHSFFTDRPLVPADLEKILPEYQYTPYTNEATKALGHIVGSVRGLHDASVASPLVAENYIRGWSGTLGMYAVQVADAALRKAGALPDPVKPTPTLADMPAIKAFVVRYPSAQAESIHKFNEHYHDAKVRVDTITHLARDGEADAAMRELQLAQYDLMRLDSIHHGLSNAQRVVELVYKNQNFAPDEKRQIIDATYMQMIEMAQTGETMLREIRVRPH